MSRTLSSRETQDDQEINRLNDMLFMVLDSDPSTNFDAGEFVEINDKEILIDELDDKITGMCLDYISQNERLRAATADLARAHDNLRFVQGKHDTFSNVIETLRQGASGGTQGNMTQRHAHEHALKQSLSYLNNCGRIVRLDGNGLQIAGDQELVSAILRNFVSIYVDAIVYNV